MKINVSAFTLIIAASNAASQLFVDGLEMDDCVAIKVGDNEDLAYSEEGCELDTLAQIDCWAADGPGEMRFAPPSASGLDICLTYRYQFCPQITECYKGCAKRELEADYLNCIASMALQSLADAGMSEVAECDLDCDNFDFSDGQKLSDAAEDTDALYAHTDALYAQCNELEEVFNASCSEVDFETDWGTCLTTAYERIQEHQSLASDDYCKYMQYSYCGPLQCYPDQCSSGLTEWYQCIVDELVKQYPGQIGGAGDGYCSLSCDSFDGSIGSLSSSASGSSTRIDAQFGGFLAMVALLGIV